MLGRQRPQMDQGDVRLGVNILQDHRSARLDFPTELIGDS